MRRSKKLIQKAGKGAAKSSQKKLPNEELDIQSPTPIPVAFLRFDSLREAAAATGIPYQVLRTARDQGCTALARRPFDIRAFLLWYFSDGKDLRVQDILDLQQERAARERAQRLMIEFELQRKREHWIAWPEIESWLQLRVVNPIRQFIASAPSVWCARFPGIDKVAGRKVLEAMTAELQRLLECIAEGPRKDGADEDDGEPREEADRDSVDDLAQDG